MFAGNRGGSTGFSALKPASSQERLAESETSQPADSALRRGDDPAVEALSPERAEAPENPPSSIGASAESAFSANTAAVSVSAPATPGESAPLTAPLVASTVRDSAPLEPLPRAETAETSPRSAPSSAPTRDFGPAALSDEPAPVERSDARLFATAAQGYALTQTLSDARDEVD